MSRTDRLNPRQTLFVDEYLVDMNATAAYRRAGYSATGKSAEVNACRLLSQARVKAEVARRMDERASAIAISQEWVIDRLRQEALNHGRGSSRVQALKLLGEHLGMFVQRHEVSWLEKASDDELRQFKALSAEERGRWLAARGVAVYA
ncbi:MAG: terminase small subunit [Gemmatimonadetes bacterium]|nr:terminase small subunit [Gemmatimonadota bacterium]